MASEPIPHSPVLRRLAADLDASTIESRLARDGDLIAEMHALGHRFRFRIAPDGCIVERFCQADPGGVLSRPEMQVLRDLAEAEMARMGEGHLAPERHGRDVFTVLGRAEIKLSLTLCSGEHLTRLEREIVTRALRKWSTSMSGEQFDPRLGSDAETAVNAIEQKLGL
jgi:hypothetical protein